MERFGFSWNFVFEYFSKICRESPVLIKICLAKPVLYMKRKIHLWAYLAQFFLEWEMFQTKFVEKIKTHFGFDNSFFYENRAVYEIMWENKVQPDTPQNLCLMRFACRTTKATCTRASARARALTWSWYLILIAFRRQSLLRERPSILCLHACGLSCLYNTQSISRFPNTMLIDHHILCGINSESSDLTSWLSCIKLDRD